LRLDTPIGRGLRGSPVLLAGAAAIAVAAIAADLVVVRSDLPYSWRRWVVAVVPVVLLLALARGDRRAVGLALDPLPSARYWVRATLVIGGLVAALVVVSFLAMSIAGVEIPAPRLTPAEAREGLFRMIVAAPLVEELVWRGAVCPAAVALLGPWGAVAASGAGFAALHVVYGNPAPDNLVAGFFLAWAHLRSGSLAVPIALHSLGNLCAIGAQLAAGAWFAA